MKTVYLIRHAESSANVGGVIKKDFASIELTDRGHRQARQLKNRVPEADHLVCSRYLRARQTAKPLIREVPGLRDCNSIWPIHEFTYMNAEAFAGKPMEAFRPYVESYWGKADPDYHDGEGAESYREFVRRLQTFLETALNSSFERILAITHSAFISGLVWNTLYGWPEPSAKTMQMFRAFEEASEIPNVSILPMTHDSAGWLFRGLSLPEPL